MATVKKNKSYKAANGAELRQTVLKKLKKYGAAKFIKDFLNGPLTKLDLITDGPVKGDFTLLYKTSKSVDFAMVVTDANNKKYQIAHSHTITRNEDVAEMEGIINNLGL